MYWSVYLHKTAVACEKVLINALLRAKQLADEGKELFASPTLKYMLYNDVDKDFFINHEEALENYAELDDNDIWSALKVWQHDDDIILSTLAKDLVDRNIFKVEVLEEEPSEAYISEIRNNISQNLGISYDDTQYMFNLSTIQKDMYNTEDDSISILYKDGTIKDISEASELLNVSLLSKKIRKYYLCYQRI
jgi:HD superfamily phosphohydrolase